MIFLVLALPCDNTLETSPFPVIISTQDIAEKSNYARIIGSCLRANESNDVTFQLSDDSTKLIRIH